MSKLPCVVPKCSISAFSRFSSGIRMHVVLFVIALFFLFYVFLIYKNMQRYDRELEKLQNKVDELTAYIEHDAVMLLNQAKLEQKEEVAVAYPDSVQVPEAQEAVPEVPEVPEIQEAVPEVSHEEDNDSVESADIQKMLDKIESDDEGAEVEETSASHADAEKAESSAVAAEPPAKAEHPAEITAEITAKPKARGRPSTKKV